MRSLSNALLVILSVLIALFVGDQVIGLLGVATETPRYAHPKNYHEVREHLEFRYDFRTNSAGLRYRELLREKPSGSRRILVVGDSYTEGYGVETGHRFTDRLERFFEQAGESYAFVNGGLSGTGPLQYARLFEKIGLGYDLDALLICLFANDIGNTPEDPAEARFEQRTQRRQGLKKLFHDLWPNSYALLAQLKHKWQQRQHAKTFDFIEDVSQRARQEGISPQRIEAWRSTLPLDVVDAINDRRFSAGIMAYGLLYPEFLTDSIDLGTTRSEAKWTNMVAMLDRMVETSRHNGIDAAVVYIPTAFQYDPRSHRPENLWIRSGTTVRRQWLVGESAIEARLRNWSADMDVPFLSLTGVFREAAVSNAGLNYERDGHWTAAGHAVAAQAIAGWLREEMVFSFVPSKPVAQ